MRSLSRRILLGMAAIGLLPFVVMTIQGYVTSLPAIRQETERNLNVMLEARMFCLSRYLMNVRTDLAAATNSQCALGSCKGEGDSIDGIPLCHFLSALFARSKFYRELAIYKPDWSLMVASNGTLPRLVVLPEVKSAMLTSEFFCSAPYISDGAILFQAAKRAYNKDGSVRGVVVASVDLSTTIVPLLRDTRGLEKSWKLYLVTDRGDYVVPPQGRPTTSLGPSGLPEQCIHGTSGRNLAYPDWRGVEVLGASVRVPDMDWVMVAEVDRSQAFALVRELALKAGAVGLLTVLLLLLISMRSAQSISRPLRELSQVARSITAGQGGERAPNFDERETHEVGEAFNNMLDQLEAQQRNLVNTASLAAVGELSSNVVHEMRNPLATIRMNLKALALKVVDDPLHSELAKIAMAQSQRLEAMLNELLHYGKPIQLNVQRTDIEAVFEEVKHILGDAPEKKLVSLEFDNALGGSPIRADLELLVRVLVNLIDNAIHWSKPGGAVRVVAAPCGKDVRRFCLSVLDRGAGIPEANMAKLFRPFFTTRDGGTGLGLAYVRKIIECHGGTVRAANNPGAGAAFFVTIPYGEPAL